MASGNNVQIQKSQEKLQNRCRANSASYEYKNMSANNGAHLVLMGIPTVYCKTWFPKTT